jgi:NTE family protein
MRGVALEGGAARGAYHIGVMKALAENGYEFDGFVGTSVGALNAALLAQGDFEQALGLWSVISMDKLFGEEEQLLFRLADLKSLKPSTENHINFIKTALKVIRGGGICTDKMKAMIKKYISEDRLRSSGKDFGLVTVSIKNRKPHHLMLEDIPQGKLYSYLMASASFPGFRYEKIGGNAFIDGAFSDNCPYGLLIKKGYDEIIAIRTNIPGVFRRVTDTKRVKIITPSENLGNPFLFSCEHSAANIALGYRDGLHYIETL